MTPNVPGPRTEDVLLRKVADDWEWTAPLTITRTRTGRRATQPPDSTIAAGALLLIKDAVERLADRTFIDLVARDELVAIRKLLEAARPPAAPDAEAERKAREAMSRARAWAAYKRAGGVMTLDEPDGPPPVTDPRPITDLDLPARALRAVRWRLNCETVGDLLKRTADDLMRCNNFGPTSLMDVREQLAKHGLALAGDPQPNKEQP